MAKDSKAVKRSKNSSGRKITKRLKRTKQPPEKSQQFASANSVDCAVDPVHGFIARGEFWEFNSENDNRWVGRVEEIREFGSKIRLDIRWLYSVEEAGVRNVGIPNEQLFSNHLDFELEFSGTLKGKVSVHFYENKPSQLDLRDADFHCWRSYDPVSKLVIPNGQVLDHFKYLNSGKTMIKYQSWITIEEILMNAKKLEEESDSEESEKSPLDLVLRTWNENNPPAIVNPSSEDFLGNLTDSGSSVGSFCLSDT